MGYINIKLTSIEIPNSFRILYKADDGSKSPYLSVGSWTDYGLLVGQPSGIYSGGTSEIMLSGQTINCNSCPDFQYGTMYWIKLEEVDYPERYVIKNIRINDSIAYPFAPTPTPSISISPSITPSLTPTPTPTPEITATPSVTITPSPTITPTPTTSTLPITSEIYFSSTIGDEVLMDVNNPNGRTFDITIQYTINVAVDNVWSMGGDPVQSTTTLYVSTNSGSTWTEVDSIIAEVSGGNYPVDQSDYQTRTSGYTLTNVTNVSNVRFYISYDCATAQDYRAGDGEVIISGVTADTGGAVIVCDDTYRVGCSLPASIYCTSASAEVNVNNLSGGTYNAITDVRINGTSISSTMYPALPYYPGNSGTGIYSSGSGVYSVAIYLSGYTPIDKFIMLYDSFGNSHCSTISAGTTPLWVTFTNIPVTSAGIIIALHNSGVCSSPTPSITPSITATPSITPTPSTSVPNTFKYYADIFNCVFPLCEGYIGSTVIENSYVLTPGKYYLDQSGQVFYILSTSSEEITTLTDMGGSGYDTCNGACATA